MIKKIILSLSTLILGVLNFGCKTSQTPAKPVVSASETLEKSLFWKISGNGLKKPSYLYGTIHIICKEDLMITDNMKGGLDKSEQLVLEIDMDEPGMMLSSMKMMMMPGGKTIKQLLSEDDYKMVNKFFKDSLKMDLGFLGTMKPMMLSSVMYPKILNCTIASYEQTLMDYVKQQKKPVLGLETIEDQMNAIDKIPLENQAKMLVESVKDYGKSVGEFKKLLNDYKNRDLEGLYKNMQQSETMEMTPEFESALLNERNQRWIPIIEKMTKEKTTFFAVGAGHLAGKNGVINLLRQKGYKVEALF
jgi:hypothetical protein